MTKLMTTLAIAAIASILVIGGLATATPNAFSTYSGDIDDDDCDNWNYGNYHNDDDDCDNDAPKDPCDCEKPDTLKFKFSTPSTEMNSEFRIEIYKKINDIGNEDKKLMSIADVTNIGDYQIESSSIGKDKLNSNTVFAIYKIVEDQDDVLVSSIEIHTSCSKALYKGLTVMDNGYSLEVTDGLNDGDTSISESNPMTCSDEPETVKMGSIVIRKAITNDNGGNANATDFTITLTDVNSGDEFVLIHDQEDALMNKNKIPVGTYTISETVAENVKGTYTTVLISGDNNCPSITDEEFKIMKNKQLSCTIYNDDDGNAGGDIEPGVIFHFDSVKFDLVDLTDFDGCDANETVLPCVINDGTKNTIVPNLKPGEKLRVSTLVLVSAVGLDPLDNTMHEPTSSTGCTFDTITTTSNNNPAFVIQCSNIDGALQFRVNYALIETLLPENEL